MPTQAPPLDQQLDEARDRAADLAERILTVASDTEARRLTQDLLVAEQEVARLEQSIARLDAIMAERSDRKAEAARQKRFKELDALITQEFGHEDAAILEALDTATEALTDLVGRVWRHNRGFRAIIQELLDLGPGMPGVGNYRAIEAGSGQIHLAEHDVFLQEFDLKRLVAEAAWSAMREVSASNGLEEMDVEAYRALAGADVVTAIDPETMAKYNCGSGPLPYSAQIRYDAAVVADRTKVAA